MKSNVALFSGLLVSTAVMTLPQVALPEVAFANAPAALANPIEIGGTQLSIPTPEGFVPVTPEMTGVQAEIEKIGKAKVNQKIYRAYIPAADAPGAKTGKPMDSTRYIYLESNTKLMSQSISPSDFNLIKGEIQKQISKNNTEQSVETQVNEKLQSNQITTKIGQVKFIPIANDLDRRISFSMTATRQVPTDDGQTVTQPMAATSSQILVNGKVLQLSVYGEAKDLTWTQTLAKSWSQDVLNANPDSPKIQAANLESEKSPAYRAGETIGRIAGIALIGGIVGKLVRRKK